MYGPGPDPAPNRRRTPIRKHQIPKSAAELLAELEVVDPPEWAWVHGLEVRAPRNREERTS